MGIIKKYDQYIKENHKIDDESELDNESDEMIDNYDDEDIDESDFDLDEDEFDTDEKSSKWEEAESENIEDEGEEEYEYIGNKLMQELADRLGVEIEDGSIEYNGKSINYYSETESFHIGKNKFKTIEEVVDFLSEEE